jgi:putative DNA primase/helicase
MRNLEKKSPTGIGQFKQSDNTQMKSNNSFDNNNNDILTLEDNYCTKSAQSNQIKPTPIKYEFDNIPADFKALDNWLLWKYELKDYRWTKVPYQQSNNKADSTKSITWCSFTQAVNANNTGNFDGIGFAIGDSGLTCIDIDHENEWPKDSLNQLLDGLNGKYYKELSPSGNGHHLWLKAVKPKGMGCKSKDFHKSLVEVYNANRFITMTGAVVAPYIDAQEAQQELETVFAPIIKTSKTKPNKPRPQVDLGNADQSVIGIIYKSKQSSSFIALHENGQQGDHSSDDLAYMNILAFYTGGNEAQMDRIFRGSALMRDKWNENRGAHDYR